jgi:hypothetical protein
MQQAISITEGALAFFTTVALPTWQALSWTRFTTIISPLRALGRIIIIVRAAGSLLPFVLAEAYWIWRQNWAEALRAKQREW